MTLPLVPRTEAQTIEASAQPGLWPEGIYKVVDSMALAEATALGYRIARTIVVGEVCHAYDEIPNLRYHAKMQYEMSLGHDPRFVSEAPTTQVSVARTRE